MGGNVLGIDPDRLVVIGDGLLVFPEGSPGVAAVIPQPEAGLCVESVLRRVGGQAGQRGALVVRNGLCGEVVD